MYKKHCKIPTTKVHYTLYTIQYSIYSAIHYTLRYTLHYTLYITLYSTLYSALYTIQYSVHHYERSIMRVGNQYKPDSCFLQPNLVMGLCSVHCAVLRTHAVCSVQFVLCSVQCAVCSVQCAVCSMQSDMEYFTILTIQECIKILGHV